MNMVRHIEYNLLKNFTKNDASIIEVVRYNQVELWHSRKSAIDFYCEGAAECDGLEGERYANIVTDLVRGKTICHDRYSIPYSEAIARNRRYLTTAPDGSRDYGGKIWYN